MVAEPFEGVDHSVGELIVVDVAVQLSNLVPSGGLFQGTREREIRLGITQWTAILAGVGESPERDRIAVRVFAR